MRAHRRHPLLRSWTGPAQLRDLVAAESLGAARLEPAGRGVAGALVLDLMFERDGRVAVVPFIEIETNLLHRRESSPFVWPKAVAETIAPETAERIEREVLPWLEAQAFANGLNAELIRTYGETSALIFDKARAAGFPGAAPYEHVLLDAAPYVYAARFAEGARVAVRDPHGAFGAVLLARSAVEVCAEVGDAALRTLAERWFGSSIFGSAQGSYDVVISAGAAADLSAPVRLRLDAQGGELVNVATPVPLDVMVSYDLEDSPAARTFGVECNIAPDVRRCAAMPLQAAGGSSGRILIALRDNWRQARDSDVDEAEAIAQHLRAEGFTVEIRGASNCDPAAFDLLHAFGLSHPQQLRAPLTKARERGIPTVVTGHVPDWMSEAAWGAAIVPAILSSSRDETALEDFLWMLEQRRLNGAGIDLKHEPFAGYEGLLREALGLADALIASGPAEEALLRRLGAVAPVFHVPAVPSPPASAEISAAVLGTSDFVLCHAPIEPRCNQFLLVRAAMWAGLPLAIVGPAVDLEYYRRIREFAGESVRFIAEPAAGARAALYRSARVYADVAWGGFGLHRIAEAALGGCALALSRTSYGAMLWPAGTWQADPASERSIASALTEAWTNACENRPTVAVAAATIGGACNPGSALAGIVQAYALAQQSRAGALNSSAAAPK